MKIISSIFAAILLVGVVTTVFGHEISRVDIRCEKNVIHVVGDKFEENLPIVVTLDGPESYSKTFEVTTDHWVHNFPLGPNGHYVLSWPNSGEFTRPFSVDCAIVEPTPTPTPHPTPSVVVRPTPTPVLRTLPPTDT